MASIDQPEDLQEQLLGRIAAGDRDAFRCFYDLHAAKMYAFALRITRRPPLAADAVQDAFLQVWQMSGRFDPARGSAGAWLLSLVRYRALDIARSRSRDVLEGDRLPLVHDGPDPLQQLSGRQEVAALYDCLRQLPALRQTMLLLVFVDGLTHVELAARLAIPLGTIKSGIRRSLLALRLCLDDV